MQSLSVKKSLLGFIAVLAIVLACTNVYLAILYEFQHGQDMYHGVDTHPLLRNDNEGNVTAKQQQQPQEEQVKEEVKEEIREEIREEILDKRLQMKRPHMETVSHTIMDSIYRIENAKKPSLKCSQFGGVAFMKGLLDSAKQMIATDGDYVGKSQIVHHDNGHMEIFEAENVSLLVNVNGQGDDNEPSMHDFQLEVDGKFITDANPRGGDKHALNIMTKHMKTTAATQHGLTQCTQYIEYPVLLLESNVDAWNWWWFLMAVLKQYIVMAVVQPNVMGDYTNNLRILHTQPSDAKQYVRSNNDAFDFLFADSRRGGDSRQIWNEQPHHSITVDGKTTNRYCFRKLVWSPDAIQGANKILINKRHENQDCFSSIVYSYAAHLKAALHIPTLPRPDKPRVVWVGRDTSKEANHNTWQTARIIHNQDDAIEQIRKLCNETGSDFIVADFYGAKKDVAFQEQALFVSRANIMIGVHGAGLNMFHFMPFDSVVVELHTSGTKGQRNSANYVNHIGEGRYIPVQNSIVSRKLNVPLVLQALKEAMDEWAKLG